MLMRCATGGMVPGPVGMAAGMVFATGLAAGLAVGAGLVGAALLGKRMMEERRGWKDDAAADTMSPMDGTEPPPAPAM